MFMKKVILFLILSTLSQTFLVLDVCAQTLTTRADRAVYSHFRVWGKDVNAQGIETSSSWKEYGYVKYDIEVSEPVPGKLHYRQLRMQVVPTATNTNLSITQSGCQLENESSRLRCYYTVKTTINFATTGIKQTASYKGGGTAGVIASLPIGAETKIEGSGEAASSTEQNITPTLSFSRSFEFAVQLRNSCTNNPGYSVYYQGQGSMPAFVPSQCTTPVPQQTKYCGGDSAVNRMANGVVDGEWQFESSSSSWATLEYRTYRLYRNGGYTNITHTNACPIAHSTLHVFEHFDWYWGHKRTNITHVRSPDNRCSYDADVYGWNQDARDYTKYLWRQQIGGGACADSNNWPQKDKVILVPSTQY
jgi:hypothetical protein